ncbi:Uncharacterized protein TCM_033021 [Theobroma cacao]|uniref:HTH myb-type domain-containing protein n=1 Tax=Theobroma cacao TaxID=3641 RepID=A0A061FB90_THECC|nr:Uncharacterized protein TCM_033021 [Theobroma cacao]
MSIETSRRMSQARREYWVVTLCHSSNRDLRFQLVTLRYRISQVMARNPSQDKRVVTCKEMSMEPRRRLEVGSIRLSRIGKSCRLRWLSYLRPGINYGNITKEEEEIIFKLHKILENRLVMSFTSYIITNRLMGCHVAKLPSRTDTEIKNYWNTCMKKWKEDFPLAIE